MSYPSVFSRLSSFGPFLVERFKYHFAHMELAVEHTPVHSSTAPEDNLRWFVERGTARARRPGQAASCRGRIGQASINANIILSQGDCLWFRFLFSTMTGHPWSRTTDGELK